VKLSPFSKKNWCRSRIEPPRAQTRPNWPPSKRRQTDHDASAEKTTGSLTAVYNRNKWRVVPMGETMDTKTRAIVLIKYKPMIEGFKNAIAEEKRKGASQARFAAMLDYVEPPTLIPT
jgi:hypothetical protein